MGKGEEKKTVDIDALQFLSEIEVSCLVLKTAPST